MDIFAGVIASEGFWMLVAVATVAGLVRGFSGFGTAMVYLPVAGQILTPFEARAMRGKADIEAYEPDEVRETDA